MVNDASRIAIKLVSKAGPTKVVSPQICLYSMDAQQGVSFPAPRLQQRASVVPRLASADHGVSAMLGNPELFVVDAIRQRQKRVIQFPTPPSSLQNEPKTASKTPVV